MPVGVAGVGAGVGVAALESGPVAFASEGIVGTGGGVTEVVSSCPARTIATKASVDESGDQTIVSGKCTAIVSEVSFLRSSPSGVYISIRYSDGTSLSLW